MRLYILRHAKSSWAEAGAKDFDRKLDERGASDLRSLIPVMREKSYLPSVVYCSPALRTRLTMHGIIQAYDKPPRIEYLDQLYSGDLIAYMDCIRHHPGSDDIMIVGHNPMCAELAIQLIGDGEARAIETIMQKFPTCAMAVIEFDVARWDAVSMKGGYLADFLLPGNH